jgi:MFS family permease
MPSGEIFSAMLKYFRQTASSDSQDSVFQEYYEAHQLRDQSPSTIAWIGSLQTFFMFSGMLFGGPLFDQYGAKASRPYCVPY